MALCDKRPRHAGADDPAMRQLTSLDQQFLALEDGRTHGHVSALGMYDPCDPWQLIAALTDALAGPRALTNAKSQDTDTIASATEARR